MRLLACTLLWSAMLLAQGTPEDDRIWDQVRVKLTSDRDIGGNDFKVTVKNGVVTLEGKVRRSKQSEKAEKITKKIKGVTSVVNKLQVTGA
jgi:osmotically-inducible protein OsmY